MWSKWIKLCLLSLLISFSLQQSIVKAEEPLLRVGETLTYKVTIRSIYGGKQIVKVCSRRRYNGHEVFSIQSNMETDGLVKTLFKYYEKEEVLVDVNKLYPLYIKREVGERGKVFIEQVEFNYEAHLAVRRVNYDDGREEKIELKLPGFVQDPVTLPFYLRYVNNSQKSIYFYSNGEITSVNYQVALINKNIKTEWNEYSSYLRFDQPESKITVMLGSVKERLPLIIQKITNLGKVEAKLTKYE